MKTRSRRCLGTALFYGWLLFVLAGTLFPLLWMLLSSFRTQVQNIAVPPVILFMPTLENYEEVLLRNPFLRYTVNSLVVASGATLLSLVIGLPAAYSIARYRQRRLALAIMAARIIPGISYLIPWYILFTAIGLIGSYPALILGHLTVLLPLAVWLMIGFFEDVPSELNDAALIDGCSELGALIRVAVPLVKSGIVATAILCFIFSWNTFMYSLVLANKDTRPLPVAVFNFMSYGQVDWGGLMAAACIITLPVIIMVLFVQRHIVSGLAFGAVKG